MIYLLHFISGFNIYQLDSINQEKWEACIRCLISLKPFLVEFPGGRSCRECLVGDMCSYIGGIGTGRCFASITK